MSRGKLHKDPKRQTEFPKLTHLNHVVTSAPTNFYNCVAWALGDMNRWWWPDSMKVKYWPAGVTRTETIEAFDEMLIKQGYQKVQSRLLEPGVEKVVLYAKGALPTHLARQTLKGKWTSKLGMIEDIEHTLEALEGPQYGQVVQVYARKI